MNIVGDFSFIKEQNQREQITHDFQVINSIPGAWMALLLHDPEKSFLWDTEGELWKMIKNKMHPGHSATTIALSLRELEYIAKRGWEEYIKEYK
jgi:hypothetical protein